MMNTKRTRDSGREGAIGGVVVGLLIGFVLGILVPRKELRIFFDAVIWRSILGIAILLPALIGLRFSRIRNEKTGKTGRTSENM